MTCLILPGNTAALVLICALEISKPAAKEVQQNCTKAGLLINAIGDNILRLLPPLTVSDSEIDEGIHIIKDLLKNI
jgi:acetylornithine/N-succinyldiaminopimelate aminotransferase